MCGICGVVGLIDPEDASRVSIAMHALEHRGPDGQGQWEWTNKTTGFGAVMAHTRLSILDLREISGQPMVDKETQVCLVFNGEIYNFKELRKQLKDEGTAFITDGDSEVILRGYLAWGDAVASKLRGMFAFAIFDPRNGRAIFGRDGYGIKPLYIAKINNGKAIAFSSEVRALLKAGFVPPETDAERLHCYLWNGFMPSPKTLIRGIDNFPRGSVGVFEASNPILQTNQFWNCASDNTEPTTMPQAVDAFQGSTQSHLIADVPLGVFLSGGIDSSAVAVMASESGQTVRTLSIGFEEAEADETRFAEVVANEIHSNHQTIIITGEEMLRDMNLAIAGLDQPSFDGINNWFVSRAAIRAGLKVALTGTGGDELLGGYTSFRRIPKLMQLARMTKWASPLASRVPSRIFGSKNMSRAKLAMLPQTGGCPVKVYQLQYALFPQETIDSFIEDTQPTNDTWGLAPQRLDSLRTLTSGLSPLRAISVLESELFLGDRLLRDTDSVSMDHSLEVRVPLVDTVLANNLAGLPEELRYHPLGSKPALRSIAEKAVGQGVFDRPKRGFEFPFEQWIRGPLENKVGSILLNSSLCQSLGLSHKAVAAIWNRYLEHPGSIYWTRIWALFILLKWCDTHQVRRAF